MPVVKFIIPLFYFFLILCKGNILSAQTYYPGMGDAGVSMVTPTTAARLNPALLGFIKGNHFHLGYQKGEFNSLTTKSIGVDIVDTQTSSLFPGAFSFQDIDFDHVDIRTYSLAIGRQEYKRLSFGLSLKRAEFDTATGSGEEHNFDFGITYAVNNFLGFSFVGRNLNVDQDQYLTKQYALGLHYIYDPFLRFSLDLARIDRDQAKSQPDIRTGLAIPISQLDLLLGYKNQKNSDLEYFTSGLVWRGPRLNLSYAYQDELGSNDGKIHFIDLGLFF